eukprot:1429488-Pleurochrysis_carterae.AAC.2
MGAKANAARKGALIRTSPKGKAKKKSAVEEEHEDQNVEILSADKNNDDNNTASNKEDKMDNTAEGNKAQEDQDQDQELKSTSSREANTPKIDISDHTKARSPLRHTFTTRFAMLVMLCLLQCYPRLSSTNNASFASLRSISNTKQSAIRTRFELAPTQTNPDKAYVFKIETAATDRPRAKFFNNNMILNGICVHLGLSDNAVADTRGFATHSDPRMGTLNAVVPPHYWERLDAALSKDGAGFVFRSILPKDAECVDRTPVTFYAKKASNNTIMRGSQKNPK